MAGKVQKKSAECVGWISGQIRWKLSKDLLIVVVAGFAGKQQHWIGVDQLDALKRSVTVIFQRRKHMLAKSLQGNRDQIVVEPFADRFHPLVQRWTCLGMSLDVLSDQLMREIWWKRRDEYFRDGKGLENSGAVAERGRFRTSHVRYVKPMGLDVFLYNCRVVIHGSRCCIRSGVWSVAAVERGLVTIIVKINQLSIEQDC